VLICSPVEPHAATGEGDRCDEHDRPDAWLDRAGSARAPHLWRVTHPGIRATWVAPPNGALKFDDGHLLHRPNRDLTLTPGTRLRLDGVRSGRCHDGGDHVSITRRFCVLDGPLAGTCWQTDESTATDGSWHLADAVAPIELPTD
jgi:hypothetical protein